MLNSFVLSMQEPGLENAFYITGLITGPQTRIFSPDVIVST